MEEPVDGRALRRDALLAFEYSYLHDDWVYPLSDTLAGVSLTEATWKPTPESKNIWQIVLHLTVWTENIVERMAQRARGEPLGEPSEGAWPPPPDTQDEAAWNRSQQRLWDALTAVRGHIETTPPAALLDQGAAGYSQLADLLCRLIHTGYHIGQITKLRECWSGRREKP